MQWMFFDCPKLKTVLVGGSWSNASVTNSNGTFKGCKALVGGNGTRYSEDHVDADYARVDAPGAPGYLTLKKAR